MVFLHLSKRDSTRVPTTIDGLENAEIDVHGYAVEYDVVDTLEMSRTMEHNNVPNFTSQDKFVGQVVMKKLQVRAYCGIECRFKFTR